MMSNEEGQTFIKYSNKNILLPFSLPHNTKVIQYASAAPYAEAEITR